MAKARSAAYQVHSIPIHYEACNRCAHCTIHINFRLFEQSEQLKQTHLITHYHISTKILQPPYSLPNACHITAIAPITTIPRPTAAANGTPECPARLFFEPVATPMLVTAASVAGVAVEDVGEDETT
ncbi:hypothetical protein HO173_005111 [Letharia columbiana]|uniref:Uncharacterized protein n=1 Tax=Letharia columbiana TaxID=112416 RepID=A0A8H6FXY1_9LECA|nr:uncharacterized protein HO173_005111 [Letharia columbiana]KAF6236820.1 hypothetical protein HO173_005111 [Letharia columbiana]